MFFAGLISCLVGVPLFRNLEVSPFCKAQEKKASQPRAARTGPSPLKTLFSRQRCRSSPSTWS